MIDPSPGSRYYYYVDLKKMYFPPLKSLLVAVSLFAAAVGSAVAQDVIETIEVPVSTGASIPEPTVVGLIAAVGVMLILRGRRRR